jgi:hypothetical protein
VSFRLRYLPATSARPAGAPRDLDDALYDLAEAGARGLIELDGYELSLDGTGVVELARGCRSLLAIVDGGTPAPDDEELRSELPGAAADAALDQWLFSSFMSQMPVLLFAVAPETTWIATRTHEEAEGWPLVVLEGRDLAAPVAVPTAEVRTQALGYLGASEADARAAFPSLDSRREEA